MSLKTERKAMEVEAETEGWRGQHGALGRGRQAPSVPPMEPAPHSVSGQGEPPSFTLSCSVHLCTWFQQRQERTRTCRSILPRGGRQPSLRTPSPTPASEASSHRV